MELNVNISDIIKYYCDAMQIYICIRIHKTGTTENRGKEEK